MSGTARVCGSKVPRSHRSRRRIERTIPFLPPPFLSFFHFFFFSGLYRIRIYILDIFEMDIPMHISLQPTLVT